MFRRLIGRYLEGSMHFSIPSFTIWIILAILQLFGNHSLFSHWLYIFVISVGNLLNVLK